jgi:hypothetical protein
MWFFRRKKQHSKFRHIAESLLVGTGLILLWRGIWGILDIYLFPNERILSYAISIGLGLLVLLIDDLELNELNNRH